MLMTICLISVYAFLGPLQSDDPDKTNPLIAEQLQQLPQVDVEGWRREANGGLAIDVINRIENSIFLTSLGDVVVEWSLDKEDLELSSAVLLAANKQLGLRRESREQSLAECRAFLLGKVELKDKDIAEALSILRKSESRSEARLNEALDEILPPIKKELLCRKLIGHRNLEILRVPMLTQYLSLSAKQVAAFNSAAENFKKAIYKNLDKGVSNPGTVTDPEVWKKILAAENLLDERQFTIYAQCNGIIENGKSLEEQFRSVDSKRQAELAKAYQHFRAVRDKLGR